MDAVALNSMRFTTAGGLFPSGVNPGVSWGAVAVLDPHASKEPLWGFIPGGVPGCEELRQSLLFLLFVSLIAAHFIPLPFSP